MVIFSDSEQVDDRFRFYRPVGPLAVTFLFSLSLHLAALFFILPAAPARVPVENFFGRISLTMVSTRLSNPVRAETQRRSVQTRAFAQPVAEPVPVPTFPVPEAATPTAGQHEAGIQESRVALPDYSRNTPPQYPIEARRHWQEGQVILRVFVSETGDVSELSVEKSSGHTILDAAAAQAVRLWKFIPAQKGNTSVSSVSLLPVSFNLKSGVTSR